jgi:hypothetical protein
VRADLPALPACALGGRRRALIRRLRSKCRAGLPIVVLGNAFDEVFEEEEKWKAEQKERKAAKKLGTVGFADR